MRKVQRLTRYYVSLLLLFAASNLKAADTTAIRAQLAAHRNELYYPNSVERFYKTTGFRLAWIAPDTVKTHAWDAMLLLDCVIQYGLNHSDYHPGQLLYPKLHELIENSGKSNSRQTALYDIMLTDAVIAFANNLHYGRLNQAWPPAKIDKKTGAGFRAEVVLANALTQKDFYSAIISAQPTSASYKSLQYKMHLVTGLYTGDCYETPESVIRLMAVNLERMRWVDGNVSNFIAINIPSKILSYYTKDTVYRFKIKNGISRNLPSSFNELAASNGAIVLRQEKKPLIIPVEGKQLIANDFIMVQNAGKLASLLYGHLVSNKERRHFQLIKPLAVYVTYYTCEMQDGVLISYKDIDHRDEKLERALYRAKKL